MSKFKPPRSGICLSHELIRPVLGSRSNIQPKVVARAGKKKEIQKPNSKALEKRMLVRAISHEMKIPKGKVKH